MPEPIVQLDIMGGETSLQPAAPVSTPHAQPAAALFEGGAFAQIPGQIAVDAPCEHCGSPAAAGTCPRSIPCPECSADPGAPCMRPSGHRAARLHSSRIAQAER